MRALGGILATLSIGQLMEIYLHIAAPAAFMTATIGTMVWAYATLKEMA